MLTRQKLLFISLALVSILSMGVPSYGESGRSKASLPGGVVVEEVGKDSAGERAGIKPRDVLLSWVRLPSPPANPEEARGRIDSPFDLADVETEQAPRGEVKLSGTREGKAFSAVLPPGDWKVKTRPQMPESLLSAYQEGKSLIEAKEPDKGFALWRQAAAKGTGKKAWKVATWLFLKTGDALADLRKWNESHAAYRTAIDEAKNASDWSVQAQIWTAEGKAFLTQNDFPGAESAYRNGLEILQRQTSQSLAPQVGGRRADAFGDCAARAASATAGRTP